MSVFAGTVYEAGADLERWRNTPVAAVVRTATDRPRPYVDAKRAPRTERPRRSDATSLLPENPTRSATSSGVPFLNVPGIFFDPWFAETMQIIAAARSAAKIDGVDREGLFTSIEMMAAFLSDVSADYRPQLSIDDDGCASFGASLEKFYLNLTIESPGEISWYALVEDREHFKEGVTFNGRVLPEGLRDIFQLPST